MDEWTADDRIDEQDTADALAFALGESPRSRPDPRPPVLEVWHLWGNAVLDTRRFPDASRPVVLGARTGHRWRFLGVDMGWVPDPLSRLIPALTPMWSDVSEGWRSDFVVPPTELPDEEDWPLFVPGEAGPVAVIAPGWVAAAYVGGARRALDDLLAEGRATRRGDGAVEVPMTADLALAIEAGSARFIARMGPSDAALAARIGDDVEPGMVAALGFGGFLFALAVALARLGGPTESTTVQEIPPRLVELLLEQPPPPPPARRAEGASSQGERAKGPEGRVGKPDASKKQASGARRRTERLEMDRRVAESAGVLGAYEDEGWDGVTGPSGISDLSDGIGGVIGDRGVQYGSDGLADRGDGFGGGGEAEGLGGVSTKPGGDGRGEWGADGADHGEKGDGLFAGPGGDPIVLGPIDPSVIDEVVKRHLQQIRYCYQRELPKDPTLKGDIVVRFAIARDGSVSSAETKASTMGNAAVESCVAGRFLRMEFPPLRGGTTVVVSYPFTFHAGR